MAQAGAVPSISRQAARERAFRLLAGTVTALFLAFAALGGAFLWYDRAAGWLTHAHEVRIEIEGLRLSLTEAESAQRAFILTGDSQFTRQIEGARTAAAIHISALERLTADNPEQLERLARLQALMAERGLARDQVAFTGDDAPDLSCMLRSGLAVAVANAHPWILGIAHWRTRLPGGHGAAREVCDLLLAAQGHDAAAYARYAGA